MPSLYIITGSNGAGKSTVGTSYLPEAIQANCEIFDGDKLAMQKRGELYKHITPSFKEAGRLALEWLFGHFHTLVKRAMQGNDDFVYEGHLPEDANWRTPEKFKAAGYLVNMIFFGLTDTNLSELRVMDRAKMGGHNVPPYEIERNYYGNLFQLNKYFSIIDELKIVDTSEITPKILAVFQRGEVVTAVNCAILPDWFVKGLPALFEKMQLAESSL